MRVLILGGAGFIGYHLARSLVGDGHQVTVVDDFSRGPRDTALMALGVEVTLADLTLRHEVSWWGVWDEVYVLAAIVGVPNVERDPWEAVSVNTEIALNAAFWLRERLDFREHPPRVFFASTSEVYAGTDVPIPTPEDVPVAILDVTQPRATYAASKILGEAAMLHCGASVTVGRFHNIYGPRMGTDHVIPDLCVRYARRDDPLRLLGPECQRAFCYVTDAVRAMRAVMGTPAAIGQIVNIGDDRRELSVMDLAEELSAITGHRPTWDIQPAPTGSVKRRCPDLTKLRRLTGYEPQVALTDGLKETYAWYSR